MKKISLTIVSILCFIDSYAQHIALSRAVGLSLPVATESLTIEKLSAYTKALFGYSKLAVDFVPAANQVRTNEHYYKSDSVLITLVHGKLDSPINLNYLADAKKGLDNVHKLNGSYNNYTSSIEKINNNNVLITYDEMENVGYYYFYCRDNINTLYLNGILQFNVSNKNKATVTLQNLLNSVILQKE